MFIRALRFIGPNFSGRYTAVTTLVAMHRLLKAAQKEPGDWLQQYPSNDPRSDKLTHVVLMRGYKEPLDLMFCTIDSLRRQTVRTDSPTRPL